MTAEWLAALYSELARALSAETSWPEWICEPGWEWPLWVPALNLASHQPWPKLETAVQALAAVPAAPRTKRREAYNLLFVGNGQPPIFLYESLYLNGRLLGPATVAVQALYGQLGLEIQSAELPDHAAVELEFLAYLAEREAFDTTHGKDWRTARNLFVEQHAGRWLPAVGSRLAAASEPAWAAIGRLLMALLALPPRTRRARTDVQQLPRVINASDCNLCGFCAQVCPTRAIWVDEDETLTRLRLRPDLCVRCRKCEKVCDERVIEMTSVQASDHPVIVLRQSERVICPGCGKATVSQAELAAVAAKIGHPVWLEYCLDCRTNGLLSSLWMGGLHEFS